MLWSLSVARVVPVSFLRPGFQYFALGALPSFITAVYQAIVLSTRIHILLNAMCSPVVNPSSGNPFLKRCIKGPQDDTTCTTPVKFGEWEGE